MTVKHVFVSPEQRSQLVFSLSHFRGGSLKVLVAGTRQKQFFSDVLLNCNYPNISFFSFQDPLPHPEPNELLVILDIPPTLEELQPFLQLPQDKLLVLLRTNRKLINMIGKKIDVHSQPVQYSSNKFVGINDKLRQLVDSNYSLNRQAFYAYGEFINNYHANLLKRIFRTELLDVARLARSFGFTTPPRVKDGHFLTPQARKEKLKTKNVPKVTQAPKQEKKSKLKLKEKQGKSEKIVEKPVERKEKKIKKVLRTKN